MTTQPLVGASKSSLDQLAAQLGGGSLAARPVERWNPSFCGAIDIRIEADGRWFHEGRPIDRAPLVRLFASILRKDADGETHLVTPVEKLRIEVVDAPFVAVDMQVRGSGDDATLAFATSLGEVVAADADHPLRFVLDPANGGLKPYVTVRGRLEARLSRGLTFELADRIEADGEDWVIRSGGARFVLPPEAIG
ncbi:DUF1285 domain-containing protein [Aurantimonas sp. MSK8Z-1]|uniref:DUF1285 domain-containing protein n=1 Tax=Mangrovibrevibacter kandeliae TaxID=2968473 RepID=UPI002117F99C|nr:DUF1285 domain-containing protein [Aurantimonas sp. MSK8Z-1]MCW4113780.1 DUF1285 domain-containing protein [Aurantimonas sp. MSK8Z-1]